MNNSFHSSAKELDNKQMDFIKLFRKRIKQLDNFSSKKIIDYIKQLDEEFIKIKHSSLLRYELIKVFANSQYFSLPVDSDDYLTIFKEICDNYCDIVKYLFEVDDNLNRFSSNASLVKEECNLIYSMISSDNIKIEEIFKRLNENFLVSIDDGIYKNNSDTIFYRARSNDEIIEEDRKQFFHVCCNDKSKVGEYRYNKSKEPCLYLSNSPIMSIKEVGKKKNNYIAGFKIDYNCKTKVRLIEFGIKPCDLLLFFDKKKRTKRQTFISDKFLKDIGKIDDYLVIYPLVLAVSFVCSTTDNQKYKISQAFIDYIKNKYKLNNCILGIRYFSCKNKKISEEGYNYVFPTYDVDSTGYCSLLKSVFMISNPLKICSKCDNELINRIKKSTFKKI